MSFLDALTPGTGLRALPSHSMAKIPLYFDCLIIFIKSWIIKIWLIPLVVKTVHFAGNGNRVG